MSNHLWLIDAGHGGLINGVYNTEGKRSPVWPNGMVLYEGEFNRAIANRLMEKLALADIRFMQIHDSIGDTPLKDRVEVVNFRHYIPVNDCILISIHANAGGGSGFEVYTSPGETRSDAIASVFYRQFEREFPNVTMRKDLSDGDPDKESSFYMLTQTACPAILLESFFMDNKSDCLTYLLSPHAREKIAEAYFKAILQIETL